jgi:hypothetical protein
MLTMIGILLAAPGALAVLAEIVAVVKLSGELGRGRSGAAVRAGTVQSIPR